MAVAPPARVRVLLVDDTTEMRFLLRLGLELDGRFDVVGEADDGEAAIRLADELRPDVAIVDLAMPRMDGLQALPRIRRCSPATRVVVLSAFSTRQMAEEAYAAGADAYLEKGAAAEDVVSTIGSLVGVPRSRGAALADPRAASAPDSPEMAVDDLVCHIGHELRHPLVVLAAFVGALRSSIAAGDEGMVEVSLDAIERNTRILDGLVHAFVDARELDVGRLALDLELIDLTALTAELVDDLAVTLVDHHLLFRGDPGTLVLGDPVRLRQIVTNLVMNAEKFSPPGTLVEVTVGSADGAAVLAVRDQGPGVPATERERLFRKFARLPEHRHVKGTGLGLYLVRGIASAHGGQVSVEDASGGGAQFVVRLPPAT
ncbi:MAG TPA: hybrid sensor histidine kinase/response regulator [Acidimicrobiales bacterium]|nr:hybrid sensor histidine kinase/response regulator [Acidimicrobiales bacterium]